MRSKGKQIATYWAPSGQNAYGEESFATGILLNVHWEDRHELVRLPNGEEITSRSIVYVPCEVEISGYLILGDFIATADPATIGAREIQDTVVIPSLRTNTNEIRAIL